MKMYRILYTVAGLLLSRTVQHFISPPTWCHLATMCNHTGIPECAQQNKEEENSSIKIFMDECDLFEYNCDNLKEYNKIDMINCERALTTVSAPSESITFTSTLITTTARSFIVLSATSVTNIIKPTELQTTASTQQINKGTTTPSVQWTRQSNSSISHATKPSRKICTRNQIKTLTAENISTTSFITFTTKTSFLPSNTLSSTTPISITNIPDSTIPDTQQLDANHSSITVQCTRHKYSSSPITTLSLSRSTPTNIIITSNCTRKHNQNMTTKSFFPLTSSTLPSTSSTTLFTSTSSTTQVSTSVPNVIDSTILPVNTSTQQIIKSTGNKIRVKPDCTRHTKSTSPINTTISSFLITSSLTSTSEIIASTTPFTKQVNESETTLTSPISVHHNCTRTHNNTLTTKNTSSGINSHLNTLKHAMKPMVITTGASKTLAKCQKYPKKCKRPSTWETTAQGETRDFFQILRAKFGTRVRFLRASTHWPVRAPFIMNDDKFLFGRHSES